jgi:hypothetical protein
LILEHFGVKPWGLETTGQGLKCTVWWIGLMLWKLTLYGCRELVYVTQFVSFCQMRSHCNSQNKVGLIFFCFSSQIGPIVQNKTVSPLRNLGICLRNVPVPCQCLLDWQGVSCDVSKRASSEDSHRPNHRWTRSKLDLNFQTTMRCTQYINPRHWGN